MASSEDLDLIHRYRSGDAAAFSEIRRKYDGNVERCLGGEFRFHGVDNDDVRQEVWRRLARALKDTGKYDPTPGALEAYIIAVARNEGRTHRRKKRRQPKSASDFTHPIDENLFCLDERPAVTCADLGLANKYGPCLEAALSQLSDLESHVVHLWMAGRPIATVADALGITPSRADRCFHRALKKIGRALISARFASADEIERRDMHLEAIREFQSYAISGKLLADKTRMLGLIGIALPNLSQERLRRAVRVMMRTADLLHFTDDLRRDVKKYKSRQLKDLPLDQLLEHGFRCKARLQSEAVRRLEAARTIAGRESSPNALLGDILALHEFTWEFEDLVVKLHNLDLADTPQMLEHSLGRAVAVLAGLRAITIASREQLKRLVAGAERAVRQLRVGKGLAKVSDATIRKANRDELLAFWQHRLEPLATHGDSLIRQAQGLLVAHRDDGFCRNDLYALHGKLWRFCDEIQHCITEI